MTSWASQQPPPIVWEVARESVEWVGPIDITLTIDGVSQPYDPSNVQFAVLEQYSRPIESDWTAPVPEPGGTKVGVQVDAVEGIVMYGIWARLTEPPNAPVLEPREVGYIRRT